MCSEALIKRCKCETSVWYPAVITSLSGSFLSLLNTVGKGSPFVSLSPLSPFFLFVLLFPFFYFTNFKSQSGAVLRSAGRTLFFPTAPFWLMSFSFFYVPSFSLSLSLVDLSNYHLASFPSSYLLNWGRNETDVIETLKSIWVCRSYMYVCCSFLSVGFFSLATGTDPERSSSLYVIALTVK